jgi:redox-sensing transcriptional repressor
VNAETATAVKRVPDVTIERLAIYSRVLWELEREGRDTVSSRTLAEHIPYGAAQIRRDFAWFGQFGTRGKGYHIPTLRRQLDLILGVHVPRRVALVGVGNLGTALLGYTGFREHNFDMVAAFDVDPSRIGVMLNGVPVYPISELSAVVRREGIEIGVITVPTNTAQEVLDMLVRAGVRAVLNFAPTQIVVPKGVRLRNVDLSVELEHLSYYLERRSGYDATPDSPA